MADKEKNIPEQAQETSLHITEDVACDSDTQEEAIQSYLVNSQEDTDALTPSTKPQKKKLPKAAWWVIIGTSAVLLIVIAIILLLAFPKEVEPVEFVKETPMNTYVDENKQHQASPKLNSKGELENNSYGTLMQQTPAEISQIDIENASGNFTIIAKTQFVPDETTGEALQQATVYTLKGFEDIEMQSGTPDAIANDCALVKFTKVANLKGDNEASFGFDNPRATVKTTYVDGSFSTITVGDQAPNQSGSYVRFGTNKHIYLVPDSQVDALLFSVLDLMPLEINKSATTVENSTFSSIKLSGTAFPEEIHIKPNTDQTIDMPYVLVSPTSMFASDNEVSYISGAIRGLFAQKAVCINPSDKQLSDYGLKTPYAKLTATYPDATVTLIASKPQDGSVYIMGDNNIIYQIGTDTIPWVSTSQEKLVSDVVLKPNFNPITSVTVTDSSGTYNFNVTTIEDTVDTTNGATETFYRTTATYNSQELDSDNFFVFYQNLCAMANVGTADKNGSGTPVLTITLSYSTNRADDTIRVYATDSTKYIASLNSQTICLVSKNYCNNFSDCVQQLISGKTVSSF